MKNKIKNILFFLLPIIILLIIQQAFYPAIMSYDGLIQWDQVQSGKIDNAPVGHSTSQASQLIQYVDLYIARLSKP